MNRNDLIRLYFILGSLLLMGIFIFFTNILIQNAKNDAQLVPKIFAKYIAYTDSYLKNAEVNSTLVPELFATYLTFIPEDNYEMKIAGYIRDEFIHKITYPVILTDNARKPTYWKNVGIDENKRFDDLNFQEQRKLFHFIHSMSEIPVKYKQKIINYVYYLPPVTFQDFIKQIDYPIIVTDKYRIPLYWRNVGINENLSYSHLTEIQRKYLSVKELGMYEIPLQSQEDNMGYVYFTASKSLQQIRYMTIIELLLVISFIIFGVYGLLLLRKTEKDALWVSLAKETAHQFGTPITSLVGWIDFLRIRLSDEKNYEDFRQLLDHMSADVDHLKNIAFRFGKVGSSIELIPYNLNLLIEETVSYFDERLPHLGSKINIHYISKIQDHIVKIEPDLIKWTLENIIKNCIDAMTQKGGNIIITATYKNQLITIQVKDEGKGMPKSMFHKIFEPGVTTKSRGWGLGLSLAKRIIEDYHHGKIRVVDSTIGEGTTLEITLREEP
jgi:signal transduction histidine kinase